MARPGANPGGRESSGFPSSVPSPGVPSPGPASARACCDRSPGPPRDASGSGRTPPAVCGVDGSSRVAARSGRVGLHPRRVAVPRLVTMAVRQERARYAEPLPSGLREREDRPVLRESLGPAPGLPGRRTLTPARHATAPAGRTDGRREAWAEKCCPPAGTPPGRVARTPGSAAERPRHRPPGAPDARRSPGPPGRLAGPLQRRPTPTPPPHAPPHRNPHAAPPTPGVLRSGHPPRPSGPCGGPSRPPLTSAF